MQSGILPRPGRQPRLPGHNLALPRAGTRGVPGGAAAPSPSPASPARGKRCPGRAGHPVRQPGNGRGTAGRGLREPGRPSERAGGRPLPSPWWRAEDKGGGARGHTEPAGPGRCRRYGSSAEAPKPSPPAGPRCGRQGPGERGSPASPARGRCAARRSLTSGSSRRRRVCMAREIPRVRPGSAGGRRALAAASRARSLPPRPRPPQRPAAAPPARPRRQRTALRHRRGGGAELPRPRPAPRRPRGHPLTGPGLRAGASAPTAPLRADSGSGRRSVPAGTRRARGPRSHTHRDGGRHRAPTAATGRCRGRAPGHWLQRVCSVTTPQNLVRRTRSRLGTVPVVFRHFMLSVSTSGEGHPVLRDALGRPQRCEARSHPLANTFNPQQRGFQKLKKKKIETQHQTKKREKQNKKPTHTKHQQTNTLVPHRSRDGELTSSAKP